VESYAEILDTAVAAVGGAKREGQHRMAAAVAQALETDTHVLVQAGTGTGKSLGYLAPALAHAHSTGDTVVVATATLALQTQLATKDIPAALQAAKDVFGVAMKAAVVKGRSNYACLLKVRDGVGQDQMALLSAAELAAAVKAAGSDAETVLGAEVVALREWAEEQVEEGALADRDDAPSHSNKAWAQVSVSALQCVGAAKCPFGDDCRVELSRRIAASANLVVTNHALLATDAMQGNTLLPAHTAVVIDEAHELVDRVTSIFSRELSPQALERATKSASKWIDDDLAVRLQVSSDELRDALEFSDVGRVPESNIPLVEVLSVLSSQLRDAVTALNAASGKAAKGKDKDKDGNEDELALSLAAGAVQDVYNTASRMSELKVADVVWVSERPQFGRQLVVAPLDVTTLMREKVFAEQTAILTSATLKIGGRFEPLASRVGFEPSWRIDDDAQGSTASQSRRVSDDSKSLTRSRQRAHAAATGVDEADDDYLDDSGDPFNPDEPASIHPQPWRAIDVGSPFDYRRQGICYIAKDLNPPGRDGISPDAMSEIAEMVWAAGGRTLGLFASQRNAEAAATYVRKQLPKMTLLCQGDAQLSDLTKRFISEAETSLFGTLSLWQGIDVPGDTCTLVIIDKIPFPRPDDPLMQARQQAVAESGGNGFMAVAATHAGLLLAQGSGRLIRSLTDRGVVAILDPRLVTARYGSFLRASLPDFWTTTSREDAITALQHLTS
jgi:ATP-dependent DNA helicase DinG